MYIITDRVKAHKKTKNIYSVKYPTRSSKKIDSWAVEDGQVSKHLYLFSDKELPGYCSIHKELANWYTIENSTSYR